MSAAARRLYGLRSRLGGAFDQECRIATPTLVSNGAGGTMPGTPTLQGKVRCEVRFPTTDPTTATGEAAESTLQRVEIRLPVGTSVSVRSRILVAGIAYEVQGHDVGRSFATEIVCDCVRLDDGASLPFPDTNKPSTYASTYQRTY